MDELSEVNVTKYKTAAEIANKALSKVIEASVPGALLVDICQLGDEFIQESVKNVYTKGKILKGVAFPTCVAIKNAICHLSPLKSEPEGSWVIKDGEMVRIELGVHIDGYIAQVAHTLVVGSSPSKPIKDTKADVIQAAYLASEAAIRLIKPGKTNWEVTDAVQKIAKEFGCNPIEGMLTHQIKKDVLDGEKTIILNPTDSQRKDIEEVTFEEGEAYSIDILISTGDGKPKELDTRTTVFKKNANTVYNLKMKTSRAVFSEVTKNNGTMAFTLRSFEDEKKAKMGVIECVNHHLVSPYTVLYEKEDAFIAHFMFTVLLMPSGSLKITSFPWNQEIVQSEKTLQDQELVELLKQPVRASKKKKSKAAETTKE